MTSTEAPRPLVESQVKDVVRIYLKHVRWHNAVDAYIASGRTAPEPNPRRMMPSKTAKYRMYDICGWLRAYTPIQVERPSTLSGVALVIEAAQAYLAGAPVETLPRVSF